MECSIGIVGKDFVLVASDTQQAHSIVVMKHDDDKMYTMNDTTVMVVNGEVGDRIAFSEYISKNLKLYKMVNGYDLSVHGTANYTRRELATALRSRDSYQVNLLIAGYDKTTSEPSLYFLDYLAASIKVPFALHGYGAYFGLSICDKYYKENMTQAEAVELFQKIVAEIQKRFFVSLPAYHVRVVSKDGVKDLGTYNGKAFNARSSDLMDTY